MRIRGVCGLVAAVALLAAGCASGPAGPGGDAKAAAGDANAAAGGAKAAAVDATAGAAYPVRVADCAGKQTVFEAAPKRIVTSNASALELLLELGAGERLIGTGFPPGAGYLPAELAARGAKVPVLGDMVIAKEKLLGSGADLYIDTFGAMSMGGGMGGPPSEQEFTAAGIKHLYLLSTACPAGGKAARTDLAEVEQDVKRLGAVTGTLARADELVAAMTAKTDRVTAALAGLGADRRPGYFFFDFDAGTKQPMAVCGGQVANAVVTLAGARNVFAGCEGDFKPVSWEDVVAADPDWIQLGVRNRGSAEATARAFDEAEQFLRTNPATRELAAVRQGRFLRIGSEVTTIAGLRNADTVQQIAHTLHPDLVKDGR
ncbi:ABC transporter substrate-binding protein [Kitasatospora sp. MMS16-BH015]|uniref:ABC transporter substrate-binding protein n=1 Tax=Kitasatospora sp. MMS16-BH015 TaxID=2018025 RepID=UPI000CA35F18|nr:ABC transporter substrate-binding protein [Kitasatospora sp. MMS16-BH015]AUG77921.1 ABC transporter substrate-binding protein [Kitasatospora sp. MMS16-BH015]